MAWRRRISAVLGSFVDIEDDKPCPFCYLSIYYGFMNEDSIPQRYIDLLHPLDFLCQFPLVADITLGVLNFEQD